MAWSLQDSWLLGAHSNQAWPHYCVPLTIAWTWVASITASNLRSGGSPRIRIGRFVVWHHKESRKGHPVPLSFPFFSRALQFTRLSSKAIPMLYFSLPSCCLCTLAGVWDRSSSGWIEKKNNKTSIIIHCLLLDQCDRCPPVRSVTLSGNQQMELLQIALKGLFILLSTCFHPAGKTLPC